MRSLKLFVFGPGIGESIILRLPNGRWGIVDYYADGGLNQGEVLDFLHRNKVKELAFFCLTHPHADHYLGALHLLSRYAGRIERIWRYSGTCIREIEAAIAKKALRKAQATFDIEAADIAKDFVAVIAELRRIGATLPEEHYRRVTAGMSLLKEDDFEITALRPSDALNDKTEETIFGRNARSRNILLLNDEEGSILNSLSVVLLIRFQRANIVLLGDAQGAKQQVAEDVSQFAVVKIAHHGSSNGLGAATLGRRSPRLRMPCGIITPYSRSRLPRREMVDLYRAMFTKIDVTNDSQRARPKTITPNLLNARLASNKGGWRCIEVFPTGKVRACTA
jgi:beta-lactamase superfamily II metal-dependent hydrolase